LLQLVSWQIKTLVMPKEPCGLEAKSTQINWFLNLS